MKLKSFSGALFYAFLVVVFASFSSAAFAERVLDETTIQIKGEERRYYRLHDSEPLGNMPIIVLVSGSGCGDFGVRLSTFFETYPAPLDVYFLEKPHVRKGASGRDSCSS